MKMSYHPNSFNKVQFVGDWFDYMALLKSEGHFDSKLWRAAGLDRLISDFYEHVEKSNKSEKFCAQVGSNSGCCSKIQARDL